jgi:hypothetical protein
MMNETARIWGEMLANYATKADYIAAEDRIAYLMQFIVGDKARTQFLQLMEDSTFRRELEKHLTS